MATNVKTKPAARQDKKPAKAAKPELKAKAPPPKPAPNMKAETPAAKPNGKALAAKAEKQMTPEPKTQGKADAPSTEEKDNSPEGPILDLSDAAVKKMIKAAKARGYVTHEELNKV